MKRRYCAATAIALSLVLMLSACSRDDRSGGSSGNSSGGSSSGSPGWSSGNSSQGNWGNNDSPSDSDFILTEGMELHDFYEPFANYGGEYDNYFHDLIEDDYDLTMANISRWSSMDAFWQLTEFDHLIDGSGQLLFYPLEGTKQWAGDFITCIQDDIFQEDIGPYQAGDREFRMAVFDTKNLTLSYESNLIRDGQRIMRVVFKAVYLPNGTMLYQYYCVVDHELYPISTPTEAVFMRYDADSYSAIIAEMPENIDFEYSSIIGRGDVTTEQMAQGLTVTAVFTYQDGSGTIELK